MGGLLVFGYNRRKVILGSGVILAVLLLFAVGFGKLTRYTNSSSFKSDNKVQAGGIRIDSSGIHGAGISVDSNGVKSPGVSIDNNAVKVDLPGVKINIKN